MAFNRDSTLDIVLGTGSWNGGASDGITLWFVEDQAVAIARKLTWRRPGREIQPRISTLGSGKWPGSWHEAAFLTAPRFGLW